MVITSNDISDACLHYLSGAELAKALNAVRIHLDGSETRVGALKQTAERLKDVCQRHSTGAIATMSAFETLEALSNGNRELTNCSICLGYLGETTGTATVANKEATISMTKCGHLFCRQCLNQHMGGMHYCHCPECRKEITAAAGDVVYVDPSQHGDQAELRKRMKLAKNLVRQASHMLEESEGMLSAEMWDQLYLSIDGPKGVNTSLDNRISAVPRHFLAHVRSCTAMPVHNKQLDVPDVLSSTSGCISTKIQCLLRDLPTNERSVVFSASKATIHHLEFVSSFLFICLEPRRSDSMQVLKQLNIGCRSLFSGQKVECTERAVTEWESGEPSEQDPSSPFPVLLVQAGAAASGLTLTAACKMFFMEPFLRYSEEQQAYGRCHRFGQKQPVVVKCYFAPVSVESRLLKWRKLVGEPSTTSDAEDDRKMAPSEPNIVFARAIDREEDEEEYVPENDEEIEQEEFLLGLHEENQRGPSRRRNN